MRSHKKKNINKSTERIFERVLNNCQHKLETKHPVIRLTVWKNVLKKISVIWNFEGFFCNIIGRMEAKNVTFYAAIDYFLNKLLL